MLRLKHKCYFIVFISLIFISSANAAFNDIGVGARPLGLGGAFVALADDSNAANYNSAGLAYIEEIHIGATYAQRFSGLVNYSTISGIIPIGGIGTLGANIGILSEESDIYQEQTIRFTYGRTLFKQLGFGLNIKYLSTNFDSENQFVASNPYFVETSSSAVSLDIGLLAKPMDSINIGVSVENVMPADVSISDEHTETVPMNFRAGIAYRLESIAEMSAQGAAISNILKETLITVDVISRDGDLYSRIGVEMWVNPTIGVRGGYGMKVGGNSANTLNLGGSAKIPIGGTALQLDYGFQLLTGDLQDNTTQRFSVNLLF